MEPRVLYVDDEPDACMLVSECLSKEGFFVETAGDGDTALLLLQEKGFDVVLLDIRMPGKNGLQVLAEMKERKFNPRVIMLTAVGDLKTAIEATKTGANDYITKPYQIETLVSCIRRVLAR